MSPFLLHMISQCHVCSYLNHVFVLQTWRMSLSIFTGCTILPLSSTSTCILWSLRLFLLEYCSWLSIRISSPDILLSLPNNVWRLIVFAPFLIYYYYYYYYSFFPCNMNVSVADLRIYWTEFHETWWSYRYMFLVDPKVFRFVVKGVKAIFLGVQRGWGSL